MYNIQIIFQLLAFTPFYISRKSLSWLRTCLQLSRLTARPVPTAPMQLHWNTTGRLAMAVWLCGARTDSECQMLSSPLTIACVGIIGLVLGVNTLTLTLERYGHIKGRLVGDESFIVPLINYSQWCINDDSSSMKGLTHTATYCIYFIVYQMS